MVDAFVRICLYMHQGVILVGGMREKNTAATDMLGVAQVSTFWQRAMLWIWLISQVIMFAPKFEAGALAEQVTGIWCVPCNASDLL